MINKMIQKKLVYDASKLSTVYVRSPQNKKGQKNFQVRSFRCLFLQLAAEKKTPKTVHLKFVLALLTLKRL